MTYWQLAGLSFTYRSYTLHDNQLDWGLLFSAVSQYLYLVKFFMWEMGCASPTSTSALVSAHTHTHTHTRTHTHPRRHTHARTHAHTHERTQTHTLTH
jgi:hypothetical protein